MLLDCTLGSLQLFRDFVSRGFEQTLINLKAIEIFEHLLLQLNELSNFSCNIDYFTSTTQDVLILDFNNSQAEPSCPAVVPHLVNCA